MGVKYLWGIIDPICREKPVSELFGKRLAIDTSCWVVSDHQILPSHIAKPHLRYLNIDKFSNQQPDINHFSIKGISFSELLL